MDPLLQRLDRLGAALDLLEPADTTGAATLCAEWGDLSRCLLADTRPELAADAAGWARIEVALRRADDAGARLAAEGRGTGHFADCVARVRHLVRRHASALSEVRPAPRRSPA